ncbi:hypothetical protein Trydic_g4876 [Trypoxylus dichotomus]
MSTFIWFANDLIKVADRIQCLFEQAALNHKSYAGHLLILVDIVPLITLDTNKGGCIKPMEQLLLTLRFYASGNMHITVTDFMGVIKSIRLLHNKKSATAIASLRP